MKSSKIFKKSEDYPNILRIYNVNLKLQIKETDPRTGFKLNVNVMNE